MVEFRISPEITDKFPQLFVNVIVVRGWDNHVGDEVFREIEQFARESERLLRRQVSSKPELVGHPLVRPYLEMFRGFGVNPNRIKPSHVALADRVVRGGTLPNVNAAVNLYNAFSVKYLVPFGGEDLDEVDTYFELAFATGIESWTPIGAEITSTVREGDVVWRDRTQVSTTSLNYRQCEKTKLVPTTRNAYFLTEGFKGVNDTQAQLMSDEFMQVFGELLGGQYEQFTMDAANCRSQVQ